MSHAAIDSSSSAAEVEIRWADGPEDVQGALSLRERVFCGEQGVSREEEMDGLDDKALHLLALRPEDGFVIGTVRLLISGQDARIGRVAVERDWRRDGIASRMLALALGAARERGCTQARLAAQLDASGLYQRAGFTIESEPFQEAGMPHVWMARRLTPEAL